MILLCLGCQAFFAGSEMGLVSFNRLRLRHRAESGDKTALLIQELLEKPEKLFGTTLVGVNISVIVGATIATVLVKRYLIEAEGMVPLVSTAIMFPLIVMLGEIVPMSIARSHSERLVPILVRPLKAMYWVLFPVVFGATQVSNLVARAMGKIREHKNPYVTREELRLLVQEGVHSEQLHQDGKEMIHQIFELEQICAREIMVPLIDVTATAVDSGITEVIELMRRTGYSRLPVYRERIDDIIGIVQAPDLFGAAGEGQKLEQLIRPPYIVPETKPIGDILHEMQQKPKPMAIVVDEYGGVSGILTREDIIEKIVGQIEDEYDRPEREPTQITGYTVLEGKMRIEEFEEKFVGKLPKTETETLGGLLIAVANHIPQKGEKIKLGDFQFEVLGATDRKVSKIGIKGLTKKSFDKEIQ